MATSPININIPGNTDVDISIGGMLTITFISAAKFCIESGNKDAFNPPLPVDQPQAKGTVWPSAQGAEAISSTTIRYTHCSNSDNCGHNATADVPGTIKVGSGFGNK